MTERSTLVASHLAKRREAGSGNAIRADRIRSAPEGRAAAVVAPLFGARHKRIRGERKCSQGPPVAAALVSRKIQRRGAARFLRGSRCELAWTAPGGRPSQVRL